MNKAIGVIFFGLASLFVAMSLSNYLGVCVHQGDPLEAFVQSCN